MILICLFGGWLVVCALHKNNCAFSVVSLLFINSAFRICVFAVKRKKTARHSSAMNATNQLQRNNNTTQMQPRRKKTKKQSKGRACPLLLFPQNDLFVLFCFVWSFLAAFLFLEDLPNLIGNGFHVRGSKLRKWSWFGSDRNHHVHHRSITTTGSGGWSDTYLKESLG